MLTPHTVIPNAAPADDELVIVVCTDERGHTHNHYIRDAALKAELVNADTRRENAVIALRAVHIAERTAQYASVLQRAADEIAAAEAAQAEPKPEA